VAEVFGEFVAEGGAELGGLFEERWCLGLRLCG